MNPRSLLLCIVIAHTSGLPAQVSVDWNISENGYAIAVDQQNNLYTVFSTQGAGTDIILTKRASTGALAWSTFFDQTSTTLHDRATWVATDPQGNALVSGTVYGGSFQNPVPANSLLMKFSPAGQMLWRQEYGSFFDGSYTRKCVVDKAGFTYVLGLGQSGTGLVTTVRKFSPSGATVWAWYDVGIGGPQNIKFTPDSALVIAHRGSTTDGYTKLDRMSGTTIWNYSASSTTIGDVAGDAAGNSYLVHTVPQDQSSAVLRKVSPSGSLIWQNTYSITAYRVEVGADQAAVLSGYPAGGGVGAAFLKVSPAGTQLWVNNDADGPNNGFLLHAQMMMDPYDNAYLCAGTLFAMGICKVNSDGTTGWYITTPSGYANGFALGNDHAVYVTGGGTARLAQPVPGVLVAPRMLLDGPYESGTGLMSDGARAAGMLPLADPYPAMGYVHTGPPSPSTNASVLSVTGPNAIVDHVLVELRDDADNTQVLASRTALLQRDGDVVDVDGVSPVGFAAPTGDYFLAVRHRNHLGCMTAVPIALNGTTTTVDLTQAGTAAFGTNARRSVGPVMTLWCGDATFNGQVKYAGAGNDRDAILIAIGGLVPTNTVTGYFAQDVNMDGTVKYAGTDNDRDRVLQTVGGVVPTAVRTAQLP
ncbi:MAG TPA: hypothetical protein PKE21_08870 [Flavobacteriales bacterium]|nr:hypothetical protein [Flavobacteriales bacterium]HMR27574.1 hypothetical protein [Flavobacteriales bacterium]